MMNEPVPGPIFVVGIWRSGTSLLYTLLNQHPQIALTYESDLFLLRSLFHAGASKPDWMERWEFWNNALSRHHIDTGKLPSTVPDYATAATEVWKQYAKDARYGDKSPNYFDAMQRLAQDFPHARFIVIWRDLADICRSMVKAKSTSTFFAKRGMTHRALIGYRKMKLECDALVDRGIPLYQIQYEEMVLSPNIVMQGVCLFLQIPFDPCMASLAGADRSAIYEAPQHAGVKSERIGLDQPRKTVLPPELADKIARYVCYWKKESNGSWPIYPKSACETEPADLLERVSDEIYFRALRMMDRLTAFVYCYAPISILRPYRSAKSPPSGVTAQDTALSQASNQN
jgi:hypothetical protein